MSTQFDPEILNDFLTESGELLSSLELDLVELESRAQDPELLNRVFRALHTIKGSASFLALTNLVAIAHVAESALNSARAGSVIVDRRMMDLLLEAVDLLKVQMGQLSAGSPLEAPRPALVEQLARLGEGRTLEAASPASPAAPTPAKPAATAAAVASGDPLSPTVTPLNLGEGKLDLFEFLVADLDETLAKLRAAVLVQPNQTDGGDLGDVAVQLARAADFFECAQMATLATLLVQVGDGWSRCTTQARQQLMPRILGCVDVLEQQRDGLKKNEVHEYALGTLGAQITLILEGGEMPPEALLDPAMDGKSARRMELGVGGGSSAPQAASTAPVVESLNAPASPKTEPPAPSPVAIADAGEAASKKAAPAENTIRVEVGRLEALMNLVGELVLQKNRVASLSRRLGAGVDHSEVAEAMALAAGTLDRVTSDIQVAVMKTRMQPLDKLFGKYPRLIRDLATKTGKRMQLVIEGGDTEVDKSVIEELGDPLVHLLRNAADHGIEMPADRVAAGKGEMGTITLRASHEGSHVRVLLIDDGKGLTRDRIARKAVERGMATEAAVAAMSDSDVFKFIFEPGLSTAEKVSDLSGRGVGMDVVRTNIQKLKGSIDLMSAPGKGTTVSITIPLTVAILPAMLVGLGKEIYAIPLGNILEIVKPQESSVSTIGEHPVMRLRDSVLPLVSAADLLDGEPLDTPFAVVMHSNGKRVGLMVSRLIGQQEVVIKPLDIGAEQRRRAVSGATVRDDGGVSLIIDVDEVMRMAEATQVKSPQRVAA